MAVAPLAVALVRRLAHSRPLGSPLKSIASNRGAPPPPASQEPTGARRWRRAAASPAAARGAATAAASMDAAAASRAAREDELLALGAIYGDGFLERVGPATYAVAVPDRAAARRLDVNFALPDEYPAAAPPLAELRCAGAAPAALEALAARLEALWAPGEVCLFEWFEALREAWPLLAPPPEPEPPPAAEDAADAAAAAAVAASLQAARLADADADADASAAGSPPVPALVHGAVLTERKSRFQAHVAFVSTADEARAAAAALRGSAKLRGTSHPCIYAYRIERAEAPGAYLADCDDDGEAAAGGRLLHLLQAADARPPAGAPARGVFVAVSRWFGGTLLGPSRFALISNVARALLDECGAIPPPKLAGRKKK
jgi:hypothetical protein